MENVKLSAPWNEYINQLKALFEHDEDIDVSDEAEQNVIILVKSEDKYEALTHLIPTEKKFGNVSLHITIVPTNLGEKDPRYYLKKLFKGNEEVNRMIDVEVGTNVMTFIEFKKNVVQYYNDNLGDLHGNKTTVMEQIAKEVFEEINGVNFCTDNGRG